MMIVGGMAIAGTIFGVAFRLPTLAVPVTGLVWAALPFFWLMRRRSKRISQFVESMPEAVELVSRALRAGHGLASGLHLVAEEMKGPIADEFNRVFEEQNLGIPIEMALRNMADRIPVMDVRFFVIAVVIQRSTGGDLAEVLDKIGRLIRQRFELRGHVKSLTAEGRLSGVVLLGMPPSLLLFMFFSNYDYVSVFFTTPFGTKLLSITAAVADRRRVGNQEDCRDQGMNVYDDERRESDPVGHFFGIQPGCVGRARALWPSARVPPRPDCSGLSIPVRS